MKQSPTPSREEKQAGGEKGENVDKASGVVKYLSTDVKRHVLDAMLQMGISFHPIPLCPKLRDGHKCPNL